RKRGKEDPNFTNGLSENSEAFFEEVMGSSHFVNTCGSLWGLERDLKTDRTIFLGGTQRFTGQQSLSTLTNGENDWFEVLDEVDLNFDHACNTAQRRQAFKLLPNEGFTRAEAERSVKSVLKSSSTFHAWWTQLVRLKLVIANNEGKFMKAKLSI